MLPASVSSPNPLSETTADKPMRFYDDIVEALDLDSMDFMNFVVWLHERTAIDIPEADYPRLRTLDDAIAYLGR